MHSLPVRTSVCCVSWNSALARICLAAAGGSGGTVMVECWQRATRGQCFPTLSCQGSMVGCWMQGGTTRWHPASLSRWWEFEIWCSILDWCLLAFEKKNAFAFTSALKRQTVQNKAGQRKLGWNVVVYYQWLTKMYRFHYYSISVHTGLWSACNLVFRCIYQVHHLLDELALISRDRSVA